MWRLWPVLQWVWRGLLASFGVALLANMLFAPLRQAVANAFQNLGVYFLVLSPILFLLLLTIWTRYSFRKRANEQRYIRLLDEFDVLCSTSELEPKHFGFHKVELDDTIVTRQRPYYSAYIERVAVPYQNRAKRNPIPQYSKADLVEQIRNGKGFLLIGQPTDGKSRTLFEVIKHLHGWTVLRPKSDHVPSSDALSIIAGNQVVLLLDDLNNYVNSIVDLHSLCRGLEQAGCTTVVVGCCRDGPELDSIRNATGSTLGRFYSEIPLKIALLPPKDAEKAELAKKIGFAISEEDLRTFPTLGFICMDDALTYMRERFENLSSVQQDCLRTMLLIVAAGVIPLSHVRIQTVILEVFKRTHFDLRDCLMELEKQSFLLTTEGRDPVTPEFAYLSVTAPRQVVRYTADKEATQDFPNLADALEQINDFEGLFMLAGACTLYYGKHIQALEYIERSLRLKPDFISSLAFKSTVLNSLGRLQEQIIADDELLAQYGKEKEWPRNELIAAVLSSKAHALYDLGRIDEALDAFDEIVTRSSNTGEILLVKPLLPFRALFNKALIFRETSRYEDAVSIYDLLLEIASDSTHEFGMQIIAEVLVAKAQVMQEQDQISPAQTLLDETIQRFEGSNDDEIKGQMAKALVLKALIYKREGEFREEILHYDKVLERFGDAAEDTLVGTLYINKAVALSNLGQSEDAIMACDDLTRRYSDNKPAAIQKYLATALIEKGTILRSIGYFQEALNTFDEVNLLFGNVESEELESLVVKALGEKGLTFGKCNQIENALSTYEHIYEKYNSKDDISLRNEVARALLNKQILLERMEHYDDAIEVSKRILNTFDKDDVLLMQRYLSLSLLHKIDSLVNINRYDESLVFCDEALDRFQNIQDTEIQENAAQIALQKGRTLDLQSKHHEAIGVYDGILNRFGDGISSIFWMQLIARTLTNKMDALRQVGEYQLAITVFDEFMERFSGIEDDVLIEMTIAAISIKAETLIEMGDRYYDLLELFDTAYRQFGASPKVRIREWAIRMFLNKTVTFHDLNRDHEKIIIYDEILARYGSDLDVPIRNLIIESLKNKAMTLIELDKDEEAIQIYDEIIRKTSNLTDENMLNEVCITLWDKSIALWNLSKYVEVITVCDEMFERFMHSDDAETKRLIGEALLLKGCALERLEQLKEAIFVYEQLTQIYSDTKDSVMVGFVARALMLKGFILVRLKRQEEAIKALHGAWKHQRLLSAEMRRDIKSALKAMGSPITPSQRSAKLKRSNK